MDEPESATETTSTTYRQEMIKCGNPRCKKCSDGQRGHGPYWYAYLHHAGKTKKKYIGKNAPAGAIKTATTHQEPPTELQAEQQPADPPPISTSQSRRGRTPKQPPLHFWLIEESEADILGFATREQAEKWAGRLKIKSKIYEANDKAAARQEHWKFLNAWANGRASWS